MNHKLGRRLTRWWTRLLVLPLWLGAAQAASAALVTLQFTGVGIASTPPTGFATTITHLDATVRYDSAAANINTDPASMGWSGTYRALHSVDLDFFNGQALVGSQRLSGFDNQTGFDTIFVSDQSTAGGFDFILVVLSGQGNTAKGDFDARFAARPGRGGRQSDYLLSGMQISLQPLEPTLGRDFLTGVALPDPAEWESSQAKVVIGAYFTREGQPVSRSESIGFAQRPNATQVSVVPEPQSMALVLLSLLGLAATRRPSRR